MNVLGNNPLSGDKLGHCTSWNVTRIKCYKTKVCVVVGPPHRYNLVPVTQDFISWVAVGS